MLIRYTDHIHDYKPDFQREEQQVDLLGDIGINSLRPALIPSPSLPTTGPLTSDAIALSVSRRRIISACRHYWVKFEGKLKQKGCELCGDCFGTLLGCVGRCQVRICRVCRWENRLATLMDK